MHLDGDVFVGAGLREDFFEDDVVEVGALAVQLAGLLHPVSNIKYICVACRSLQAGFCLQLARAYFTGRYTVA